MKKETYSVVLEWSDGEQRHRAVRGPKGGIYIEQQHIDRVGEPCWRDVDSEWCQRPLVALVRAVINGLVIGHVQPRAEEQVSE